MSGNAQTSNPDPVDGDLGGALYITQSAVLGQSDQRSVLPYAYLDIGRFYARVDTFGVKTLPLGAGRLELAGRIAREGFRPSSPTLGGIDNRSDPVPIGIGTFQETRYGGIFLYAFRDLRSGGSLLEATYAAEWSLGPVTFYPELGVEHRSARYVGHLYGVSPAEAAASGLRPYAPRASTWPVVALSVTIPLPTPYGLVLQVRRKWFDGAVSDSPLVTTRVQDSAFAAVAYHFN